MAKRSPILGYNHNVRYRGIIWHIQTEDSGLANPHLFSHLFYEGVIVSTRKLVYDSGSDEGAIKSLMQAQHKAVMKDLKRGHFDDKIDLYLVGTAGLLPRGVPDDVPGVADKSEPVVAVRAPVSKPPKLELDELDPPTLRVDPPEALDEVPQLGIARRVTAERISPPSSRALLEAEASNDTSSSMAAAVAAANTIEQLAAVDSSPEIEIRLDLDQDEDDDAPIALGAAGKGTRRRIHDTEISNPEISLRMSDVPGLVIDDATRPNIDPRERNDSIPPLPPPPEKRTTGDRPAVGAASLPPGRPITRPPSRPAISPPPIPRAQTERSRSESDAVELYAPVPPSADAPAGERPGQYAQHRKLSQTIPTDAIPRDRPVAPPTGPVGTKRPPPTPATGPVARPVAPPPTGTGSVPRVIIREPSGPIATAAETSGAVPQPIRDVSTGTPRSRTPTPARIPSGPRANQGSGGVVMTRPAVIVGAPAKPPTSKVRKAREEEGRGFGQGLISEKSLDEVILAYLSEDADDK